MPGPANLYGVNNSPPPIYKGAISGTVAIPPTTETPFFTSQTLVAATPGYYYVIVNAYLLFQMGASAPTSVTVFAKIGAGSDFDGVIYPAALFPATGNYQVPFYVGSAPSNTAWFPSGSTVTLSAQVGTNGVTVNLTNGWIDFLLLRAPDQ